MKVIKILFLFQLAFIFNATASKVIDFNFGWKFALDESKKEFYSINFDDTKWNDIRLPHDWSIDLGYTQENTAGSNAYLPGGIGWYRKTFNYSNEWKGKKVFIYFEGVYNNYTVWINGNCLGFYPNGYLWNEYELTSYLKEGKNVITVNVNRKEYADARWYAGAGIYRNVKLIIRNDIYIPSHGIFVTTPKVGATSEINVNTEIENKSTQVEEVTIQHQLIDNGKVIAEESNRYLALRNISNTFNDRFIADGIKLWSNTSPKMYKLLTRVIINNKIIDEKITNIGFRDIKFDADKGFLLNGKSVKIKGVNLHQDLGCVGVATNNSLIYRRLYKLREMGCNAVRTAHHPHSEALMNMCDTMGLFVMDEFIDEWTVHKGKWITKRGNDDAPDSISIGYARYFDKYAENDTKKFIKRDRNHPSVILWSIGNEIEWTFPYYWAASKNNQGFGGLIHTGDPEKNKTEIKKRFDELSKGKDPLVESATKLTAWVKDMDITRPVTSGVVIPSVSRVSGYTDVLDVVGYNYKDKYYETDHSMYPHQCIIGSENVGQFYEWNAVADKEYIPGIFVWTGVDYLGENGPWPLRGGHYSFFDFSVLKTPRGHFFECLWKDSPKTYIVTTPENESEFKTDTNGGFRYEERKAPLRRWEWYKTYDKWKYSKGENIIVQVYSNSPQVELLLNGKSLGIKTITELPEHNIFLWSVPFTEGKLTARSIRNGKIESEYELNTYGKAHKLKLLSDKKTIKSDGYDTATIEVYVTDRKGNLVTDDVKDIKISTDNNTIVIGVDNGSTVVTGNNKANVVKTYNGKCIITLQAAVRDIKCKSKVKIRTNDGISSSFTFDIN